MVSVEAAAPRQQPNDRRRPRGLAAARASMIGVDGASAHVASLTTCRRRQPVTGHRPWPCLAARNLTVAAADRRSADMSAACQRFVSGTAYTGGDADTGLVPDPVRWVMAVADGRCAHRGAHRQLPRR
jgi:hypothetical protein